MSERAVRSAAAVVCLLVAAVLAAGCGEMTKAEYQQQMRAIAKDVDKAVVNIKGSERDRMRKARAELEKGISRIEDLDPPDDVKRAHDTYLSGLRGTADVMEEYEDFDPEQDQDAERTLEMLEDLRKPVDRIERAQKLYDDAGYDIS